MQGAPTPAYCAGSAEQGPRPQIGRIVGNNRIVGQVGWY
jgi:hypothetical protein